MISPPSSLFPDIGSPHMKINVSSDEPSLPLFQWNALIVTDYVMNVWMGRCAKRLHSMRKSPSLSLSPSSLWDILVLQVSRTLCPFAFSADWRRPTPVFRWTACLPQQRWLLNPSISIRSSHHFFDHSHVFFSVAPLANFIQSFESFLSFLLCIWSSIFVMF